MGEGRQFSVDRPVGSACVLAAALVAIEREGRKRIEPLISEEWSQIGPKLPALRDKVLAVRLL